VKSDGAALPPTTTFFTVNVDGFAVFVIVQLALPFTVAVPVQPADAAPV
jgi:hypothetical protein